MTGVPPSQVHFNVVSPRHRYISMLKYVLVHRKCDLDHPNLDILVSPRHRFYYIEKMRLINSAFFLLTTQFYRQVTSQQIYREPGATIVSCPPCGLGTGPHGTLSWVCRHHLSFTSQQLFGPISPSNVQKGGLNQQYIIHCVWSLQNDLIMELPRKRKQTNRYGGQDAMMEISDIGSSDSDDGGGGLTGRAKRKSLRNKRRRGDDDLDDEECGDGYSRGDFFKVEKNLLVYGWVSWLTWCPMNQSKERLNTNQILSPK